MDGFVTVQELSELLHGFGRLLDFFVESCCFLR